MKKYLALFLFALITTVAFAQSNYQDVVYLKNGSIIRGVIIEQVPNKSIKIETADRNVFVFQMEEIEKLAKEPIKAKSGHSGNKSGLKSGYKLTIENGYEVGVGTWSRNKINMDIINAYQMNPYFSIGLGIGVRHYFHTNGVLIPIFADLRINFMDKFISPYLSLAGGCSMDTKKDFKVVGIILNPTLGVSFKRTDKSVIYVGLGYEEQRDDFTLFTYKYTVNENDKLRAISINIGVSLW